MTLPRNIQVRRLAAIVFALLAIAPSVIHAGFTVSSWNLVAGVIDVTPGGGGQQSIRHTAVQNPFISLDTAEFSISTSSAHYDHSWIPELAYGDFNTSFEHQIRSPEVITTSSSMIVIQPTEDIRVTFNGIVDYMHTSGDLDSIDLGFSIRDLNTLDLHASELRRGGNLYFLPASGQLQLLFETILPAKPLYRISYSVNLSNTGDLLPTGTMDASGTLQLDIRPVPEPATAMLLGIAAIALRLRNRHSCHYQ